MSTLDRLDRLTQPDESLSIGSAEEDLPAIARGLRRLSILPEWLLAPLQSDRVAEELGRVVPEFSSGVLKLRGVKIKRMLLKDTGGRWLGTYMLTAEEPGAGTRIVALRGTFT